MLPYELLVTAVSERADLFRQTLDSLLAQVDQQPLRVLVHEDVRPGSAPGEIAQWLLDVGLHPLAGETKPGRTPKRQLESARITVAQIKRKLRERGDLPEHMRGRELSPEELAAFNARLEAFTVNAENTAKTVA